MPPIADWRMSYPFVQMDGDENPSSQQAALFLEAVKKRRQHIFIANEKVVAIIIPYVPTSNFCKIEKNDCGSMFCIIGSGRNSIQAA